MIAANQSLIQKYFDGTLDKDDDVDPEGAPDNQKDEVALAGDQARIKNEIVDKVKGTLREKQKREGSWRGEDASEEGDHDDKDKDPFKRQEREARRPAMAVLGPAGSGKTTAVQAAIAQAHDELSARVLIVAPTGRLAATYRAKYPHLDVDTIHGAFMVYKPLQQTLELMFPYDLVIVEEVGQLSRGIFERLIHLWEAAEKIPTHCVRGRLLAAT